MAIHPKPTCDFVLLVDRETGERNRTGHFTVDTGSVEAQVLRALRLQGRTAVVPFDPDTQITQAELQRHQPRLVFNLTEWIDGERSRDHVITRFLDKLGFPYTGTAGEGLRLARDKARATAIVAALGVAVPRQFALDKQDRVALEVPFPLFVKPRHCDGSDAISAAALVRTRNTLRTRVRSLRARKLGPVLCEEYIEGRDLFVALLGNKPEVLQPLELVVGRQGRGAPRFATQRLKHDAKGVRSRVVAFISHPSRFALRW